MPEWSTYVNPNDAQIQRINPIAGNPTYAPVNGGWYHASANLLGVGFNYKFDLVYTAVQKSGSARP